MLSDNRAGGGNMPEKRTDKNERICMIKIIENEEGEVLVEVRFTHVRKDYRAFEMDYVRWYPIRTFSSIFNAQAQLIWILNGNVPEGAVTY